MNGDKFDVAQPAMSIRTFLLQRSAKLRTGAHQKRQKAVDLFRNQRLWNLVAGTGFEPVTFGL
jgi:hypothetical protein